MKYQNHEGYDQRTTSIMLNTPITDLSRLIGAKWFLTIEQLSEQSGVPFPSVQKAVQGKPIRPCYEQRLREFLEQEDRV